MIISVSDSEENTVGKGEIACTSNFSFSHNVFRKASFPHGSKGVIVWEWVNRRPSENIVGKGENAGYQLFLLFP